jgi:nucleoside 2-deoxyribosyltransferase
MRFVLRYYMAHPFGDRLRLRLEEKRIERKTGLVLVNPFYDVEGRTDVKEFDKLAKKMKAFDKFSKVEKLKDSEERQKWVSSWGVSMKSTTPKEVVERDLRVIRQTDGVLAFFTDKISVGTPMEVFYASHILHHPVYLIIEDKTKMGHPWLVYHATSIFTNVDEFINSFNQSKVIKRK